ncbi:MAG: mutT/nudix family protein [Chloroflexi bacterium]|nr:mutT/nudix family protein [Chloroflexota bacterium]
MTERFDLYDDQGLPLGVSMPRRQVHRDGDWHRSIGLWIVRPTGTLIFQQRSMLKDTRPGLLTASVSGHYAAGERLEDVLREADEEIGVPVLASALIPLGVLRMDDRPAPEMIDRELQDVFLWPLDLPLAAFKPDPLEVSAMAEVEPRELLALLDAGSPTIDVTFRATGATSSEHRSVVLEDFVPMHDYHRRVARAAIDYAAGRLPAL